MTTPNGGYFLNRLPRFSECADPSRYEATQFQPNGDGHIFLLHEDEIPAMAAGAELQIVELCLFANPLTCGHVKTKPLLQVLPSSWIGGCENATRLLWRPLQRKIQSGMAVLFRKCEASELNAPAGESRS